jgi:hypothetical protein
MNTSLWDRFVHRQVLYLGRSENDILIWFLDGWYEFIGWSDIDGRELAVTLGSVSRGVGVALTDEILYP